MKKLDSRVPDLPTKAAMGEVLQAFYAVADATTVENVVSLPVHCALQYWLQAFNPNQGTCFLIDPHRVYAAAIETLEVFIGEIDATSSNLVRREFMRQTSRIACLNEKLR